MWWIFGCIVVLLAGFYLLFFMGVGRVSREEEKAAHRSDERRRRGQPIQVSLNRTGSLLCYNADTDQYFIIISNEEKV